MPTKAEKLSNSNLMIVLVLVTLLTVGATALIVKILLGSIAIDNKVETAKAKADKQLTSDVSAAPQLVDAYAALGSESLVLSDALPSTADFPSLIVTLDNMASAAGLQLSSVAPAVVATSAATALSAAPANADGAPPPQPYQFTISFTGTYDGLSKMLANIETSARPMRVDGMQLTGSGTALGGNIDLETYYQAAGVLPFSEETIK